jgi:hypothetical protein
MTQLKWKYFVGWLPLVLIAIVNGTLRQLLFQQSLGELHAHQLSTATGIALFAVYIWWVIRRWNPASITETVTIGALWVLLTIGFEFGMGHFILNRDWSVLLHDYNIFEGRVWVLVLIWVGIAPTLVFMLRRNRSGAR